MKLKRSYKPETKKQRSLIQDWVERLRKPSSRQAQGALKDSGGKGFCCLGHLCKVAGTTFERKDEGGLFPFFYAEEETYFLPKSVRQLLNIKKDPKVRIGKKLHTLSNLNDNGGLSLKDLADVIEADWLKGNPLKEHSKLK